MPNFLKDFRERYKLPKIVFGIISYLLLVGLLFQPVISNGCTETYLGGPGDQSAFAWLYEASPDSPPLWGDTTWTNAPYGENLSEPFYITGLSQYTSVWLMEKVVGPTCAFNVYAAFGYIFTATVTFLFILWLTNRRSYFIAWLAGYLIAFSPYLQIKTMYHVSYVYSGLLVLMLWLLMAYWRKPLLSLAIALMVLGASLFYHDPYFIMLAIFLCLAFIIGAVAYHILYEKITMADLWRKLKSLVITLPLFLILISPVVYVRISQNSKIESVVGSSRDTDIMSEGRAYGARPWEYVLPAVSNPLTPEPIKDFQRTHQHGAAQTETTLFLGFITITLSGIYIVHWARTLRKVRVKSKRPTQFTTLVAGAMAVVGGLMSLPPSIGVGSLTFYFPSYLLLSATTMWRVPARFFVIAQIGLVILAVLGLIYLISKYKDRLKGRRIYILYASILAVSLLEFSTFNPFNRNYWNQSMIPAVYSELKGNPQVDLIAEYPMLDPPRNYAFIFYLSYQAYHKVPMVNSAKTGSPSKEYRESIAGLDSWQTLSVLRQLGVDRVIVHGVDASDLSYPGLEKLQGQIDDQTTLPVVSYRLRDDVPKKGYMLAISDGFDGPSNYGFRDVEYFMHQSGVMKPILLPGAEARTSAIARLQYYAFEKTPRPVNITQDGKLLATVYPTESKQIVEFAVDPSRPFTILPEDAPDDYSFVVSNMEIK